MSRWKQQFLSGAKDGLAEGGRIGINDPRERELLSEIEELKAALGEVPRMAAARPAALCLPRPRPRRSPAVARRIVFAACVSEHEPFVRITITFDTQAEAVADAIILGSRMPASKA